MKKNNKRLVVWKELGQYCINGSGWGETKFGRMNDIQQTNWLIRNSLLVLLVELIYLVATHPIVHCFGPLSGHMMTYGRIIMVKSFGYIFSNQPFVPTLNPTCSTQHVVPKKTCLTCPITHPKGILSISLVSQLTSHSLNKNCCLMKKHPSCLKNT